MDGPPHQHSAKGLGEHLSGEAQIMLNCNSERSFSRDGNSIRQKQQVQEYSSFGMSELLWTPQPIHNTETRTFRFQQSDCIVDRSCPIRPSSLREDFAQFWDATSLVIKY